MDTDIRTRRASIVLPERRLYIDGEWSESSDGETITSLDPASEQVIAEIAAASSDDIERAVASARNAFEQGAWPAMSGADRGRILIRVAELIERDIEVLAALESLEVGKPLWEPRTFDVPLAAETFRHFAGWADKITGSAIPVPDFMGRPRLCYTRREPVGVVGAITPWNAPTMIAAWKIAPALAAGCTVVLKPAEEASLCLLHLAGLFQEAGLPPGVVNIVPGRGEIAGAALVSASVDKISFTGSPEVGREIARVAGAAFRRVTLELGGKSPQLVFPDADVEAILPLATAAVFANQGEICAAGSRIFVHRTHVDQVVEGLAQAAHGVTLGDPFDASTTMGPLVSAAQRDRVVGFLERGPAEGAQLAAGGSARAGAGYFVEPTVFVGTNSMEIAREEIFGPVATVIPFSDVDEAVRLANETRYGLAAVIWTRDLSTAHITAARLRAGAVWINGWGPPDPRLPWGGVKDSGIGRELGLAGLHGVTEEKLVTVVL